MDMYAAAWWKDKDSPIHSQFFENLSPKELTDRLYQMPLNKELITFFLENHVKKINQITSNKDALFGRLVPCYPWDSYNFIIYVNKNNTLDIKTSTTIHECIHGIYRAVGNSIESIIDAEELKFFEANKDFSIETFNKYSKLYE